MKWLLILLFGLVPTAYGLDAEVANLSVAIKSQDTTAIGHALYRLAGAIQQNVPIATPSNDSPEHLQARQQIQSELSPIKEELLQLAASPSQNISSNALVILGYSDGGSTVYDSLKEILTTSQTSAAATSLFSLYQMGLADADVRNVAAERIAQLDPNDRSGTNPIVGLLLQAANVPLPEALDAYTRILENGGTAMKVLAARAIRILGPDGARALPTLQQQLALLRSNNEDPRYISELMSTIDAVSSTAVNSPVHAAPTPTSPRKQQSQVLADRRTSHYKPVSVWIWASGAILVTLLLILIAFRSKGSGNN